jgi:putative ABC transport system permease protein
VAQAAWDPTQPAVDPIGGAVLAMLALALRSLRFRKTGLVALFLALFLGATIVLACGGLMESGIRDNVPPRRLGAAPMVVTGDQSVPVPGGTDDDDDLALPEEVLIDADLVDEIQQVPDVARAVGDVSFPATLIRDGAPLEPGDPSVGHGWASAELGPFVLSIGEPPDDTGEVVLEDTLARAASAAVGDRIEMMVRGSVEPYRVTGIAALATDTGDGERSAFFAPDEIQRLAPDPTHVESIGVFVAAGADLDQVRDRVDALVRDQGAVTFTGDDRGRAEDVDAWTGGETLVALSGVFGGMATIVAIFVVATTVGLSVQQREREIALLRAVGTTRSQLRRMLVGETLAVSVLATGFAVLAGRPLGQYLHDQLGEHGVIPEALRFHHGWIPTVAAGGVALLTAVLAALIASRRATRTRPTDALLAASLQTRWLSAPRVVAALVFLSGGIALAMVTLLVMKGPIAASTALPAVLAWAIGFALLAPAIARVVLRVLGWPIRSLGGQAGALAAVNAHVRRVRMAGAITPVMLATGVALANLYMLTTQVDAAQRGYTENLAADVVLTSATGGFAPRVIEQVRETPGVASASPLVSSVGIIEHPHDGAFRYDGWPLQGVDAATAEQTLPVTVTAGSLDDLHGDTVALSDRRAERIGRSINDTLTLRLGDGTQVDVRVVALVSTDSRYETLLMPADLLAAHTTEGLPEQILVQAAPGLGNNQLVRSLSAVVRDHPGTRVADRNAMSATYGQDLETQTWVNYLLVGIVVAYTAISLVNTLVTTTIERRREFGLQRLVGSTPGHVMRMMLAESVLVATSGILLGCVLSITALIPFSKAVSDSARPSGPLWIFWAVTGTATLLVVATTLLSTSLALRARPIEAAATDR